MPDADARRETLLVGEEAHGERLDKFVAQSLEDLMLSRERVQALMAEGRLQVNGKPQKKPATRLKEGDVIVLGIPEASPIALMPEAIPLAVVYEDADLLVVNKLAGMLTHPTGREHTGTLVNALLHHCRGELSGINGRIRPGIVHRLDRDTSGLLMVAKTDVAHYGLSAQLKAKTARREYIAVAQGAFPDTTGTIDAPIGRNPKQRDKMCVIDDGRPAVTHWQVADVIGDKFSRVQLRLETGRTHQIRVHLAHIGHPIVGDPIYGSGLEKILKLKTQGQLLQAFRLSFEHPVTKEHLSFEIPPDPEIERLWTNLGETQA